jgi:hypothetical protein
MAGNSAPVSAVQKLAKSISDLQKQKTRSSSTYERKKLGRELNKRYKKLRKLMIETIKSETG